MAIMIYDGDCGFCSRSMRISNSFDWLKTLRWLPRFSAEAQALGVPLEQSERALQMIHGGKLFSGWRAIKRMAVRYPIFWVVCAGLVWLTPWSALVVACGLSPLANPIGDPVYLWIARNRMRLSGAACELPPSPADETKR